MLSSLLLLMLQQLCQLATLGRTHLVVMSTLSYHIVSYHRVTTLSRTHLMVIMIISLLIIIMIQIEAVALLDRTPLVVVP